MRISSGNLGIGNTSPGTYGKLVVDDGDLALVRNSSNSHTISFWSTANGNSENASIQSQNDGATTNTGELVFSTKNASGTLAERMRLNANGHLIVNGNDSGGGAITAYNVANAFAPPIVELNNVATDFSAAMLELRVSSGSINTVNGRFIHCYSDNGSTTKMKVLGDGDLENVNNNYNGISDLKLKENIADSNSQWDDLKNLKVKKFSFKADKKDKADKIGVIAQDLEDSNMSGLVRESKDFDSEGNDLGTTTKSVKYSILYMKAVKALQEAMARIETLEAKVTALEAK